MGPRCFDTKESTMSTLRHLSLALACAVAAGTAAAADDKKATGAKPAAQRAMPADEGPGRDWSRIDTNKDGLISPEEMEAWLQANPGPLKGK
jgi:hypothetical protein